MDEFTREIIVEDRIRELQREAAQRGRRNGATESLSGRLSRGVTALLRRGGRDHRVAEAPCGMCSTADAKHA